MEENRKNWIAELNNGRYIVVDKTTGTIINDAQGYGFKNETKCWNWISSQQQQIGINVDKPVILSTLF